MENHAKVVIIGGGVVGCSILYHLSKFGMKDCILLERNELTSGSSWHAAGNVHVISNDPNISRMMAYTIGLYKEIEKESATYNMSLNTLKDLCGDSLVETMIYDSTSASWGGLVDTKYMRLREFVDDHLLQDTKRDGEPPRYLTAGLGLPQVCPKLDLYTPVPKYVSLSVYPIDHDHNEQTNGKRNQIIMPDMFIGNKGTKTVMHVDVMLGPFWMSVYLGSKTFRVVTYWDAVRHFDMYNKKGRGNRLIDQNGRSQRWERSRYDDITGKFETRRMEIWNPDLDWFPELDNVTVWEGTVNAGDWIYLPSASLHGVRNDDASWGVTINALYPATVDNQATICANSGFKLGCEQYVYSVSYTHLTLPTKRIV